MKFLVDDSYFIFDFFSHMRIMLQEQFSGNGNINRIIPRMTQEKYLQYFKEINLSDIFLDEDKDLNIKILDGKIICSVEQ